MKIMYGLFIIALVNLLLFAGCLSIGKTREPSCLIQPPPTLHINPEITIQEIDYSIYIIGVWKIQMNNSTVIYLQFDKDCTVTGGSVPGSHDLIGNWSSFGSRTFVEVKPLNINQTVSSTMYNLQISYDRNNHTFSVQSPAEYRNWTFIRQS